MFCVKKTYDAVMVSSEIVCLYTTTAANDHPNEQEKIIHETNKKQPGEGGGRGRERESESQTNKPTLLKLKNG